MTSAPPLRIEPRVSPSLLLALAVIAALAVASILASGLALSMRGVLALAALAAAALAARRLLRPLLRAFEVGRATARIWPIAAEEPQTARLRAARVMGPLLVLALAWDAGPRPRRTTLWLLPDSLDAGQHRALRMRLSARTHNAS